MAKQKRAFSPKAFLTTNGVGRKVMSRRKGQTIYAQGDAADAVFVIQEGTVKLSVKSQAGKEATLDILSVGDFVGKDSIAGHSSRTGSATAMTDCGLLRITKRAMIRALTRQLTLANIFWAYVLARNMRYQQDIVDQHCNCSEKRLARILLRLAHYDGHGTPESTIPRITQETLAEMVGTTRARVCFFMKRFKNSGFISSGHEDKLLRVNRTLIDFCSQ